METPALPTSSATITVATSAIALRCGDSDGCSVRLVLKRPSSNSLEIQSLNMVTIANGERWKTPTAGGNITDSTTQAIALVLFGSATCRLRDSGADKAYQLVVEETDPVVTECALRIDD